jgi:putative pyrroloquinoline-quinone-binding quinoprotein
MLEDPIRAAFDRIARQPATPSPEFADALLERLVRERASTPRHVPSRTRAPSVPPLLRKTLIAAAAILIAAAGLLPLLPLIGNHEEPRPALPSGQIVWLRQFGSDGFDVEPRGLTVADSTVYDSANWWERGSYGAVQGRIDAFDLDGRRVPGRGLVVDGETDGLAMDPAGNIYVLQSNLVAGVGYLTKYSPDGTELWHRGTDVLFGGVVRGLATDGDGVLVAGGTTGPLRTQDGFVASLDGDGNVRWQTTLGTDDFDRAGNIALGPDAVYVAGGSGGKNGPATLWKVDRDGSVLWSRSIGLGRGMFGPVATANGIVYAGAEDHGDAFLAAFDASGHRLWTSRWGTKAEDWVAGLVAVDGRVYVAGTRGYRRTETGATVAAAKGFVRAFDADGHGLWGTKISNQGFVQVTSLAEGSDRLYVAGFTDGVFPGQTATDGESGFVAKVGT